VTARLPLQPLAREALLSASAAAGLAAVLLWFGPPGVDFAAHAYQRALFVQHGFVLWNNFWYAGRYSFVTYSVLYYPLAALLGIRVLAVASIATAALAFAVVLGREWGRPARISSRTFAVVWAGIALSAAFPFALGAALALLALWALQRSARGRFALLALLTLAASPLAFLLLAVLLCGIGLARRGSGRIAFPAAVVAGAVAAEVLLCRLFPGGGRYPFSAMSLIPLGLFCGIGALLALRVERGGVLVGFFVVYLASGLVAYAVPSELGGNVERLRYASLPIALLVASLRGWRPLRAVLPAVALALVWNMTPIADAFVTASGDPAASRTYWRPVVSFLHSHLSPSYRVEAVDTSGHWPAAYLPEAGIALVRGWYRQEDFPENALLYGAFGPQAYRHWLRTLGVRYVVLTDAPPDFSARAEAALLRSGRAGLRVAFRSAHATVYAVPRPQSLVSGPGRASVLRLGEEQLVLHVGSPGRYRVAVRWSPYWRTEDACVARGRDGMLVVIVPRAGRLTVGFSAGPGRLLDTLVGEDARRCD
jgi:hypothetical protein